MKMLFLISILQKMTSRENFIDLPQIGCVVQVEGGDFRTHIY